MKKISTYFISCIALLMTASIAQAELQFGVVDSQRALAKSTSYMRAQMEVEEDSKDERDKIKDLQIKVREIEEKLQKDALTMSTEKQLKLRQEAEGYVVEFQNIVKLLQKQTREREQLVLKDLAPKLKEAIDLVRVEKELDVIFHAEAVVSMSADNAIDITEAVTEKMNTLK